MSLAPILLVGGSGVVGHHAADQLRALVPDVPLLIGGRDRDKADARAAALGNAEGVAIDLAAADLGLGERAVSAVTLLLHDSASGGLRFAGARGVPYVSMASGLDEMGIEAAHFMQAPGRAPVVLGTEWLVGATTIPTLEMAKRFARVDTISIGALLDDEDAGGPAQVADMDDLRGGAVPALTRRDGRWLWRTGEAARAGFRAADGTMMSAFAISPNDVLALATRTGAANVAFDLATGMSSSRRRGEAMSTEIVVGLAGTDHAGQPLRTRHAVLHPDGQMPLTGLGVALVLTRLLGLDGAPPVPAGLYFPSQILDPAAYLASLRRIGGVVAELEPG